MKRNSLSRIVLALSFLLCLGGALECMAQSKPLWVQRGEKSMNKKRQSDNYTFKVFNTHDLDEAKLKAERLKPLLEYLQETYGVETSAMTVDTAAVATDGTKAIKVSMPTSTVYAKLVDDFCEFTDYELNVFQYEYYQLYAVTEKDAAPVFDTFNVIETNNSNALARSIVPGLGQFYKGQTAKGCAIIGAEAFFVASAIAFDCKRNHCADRGWESKARGWRQFRNLAISGAGIVYVYNLIDSAVSKAGRRVKVGKSSTLNVGLAPMPNMGAGVGLALSF